MIKSNPVGNMWSVSCQTHVIVKPQGFAQDLYIFITGRLNNDGQMLGKMAAMLSCSAQRDENMRNHKCEPFLFQCS